MQLQVHPLEPRDFDELISHASLHRPGDDLTGPPTPLCCPVTTKEEAQARLTFHFNKQRCRFDNDPTARYMKVIDSADKNSIISIARWHFYPNGYDFDEQIHWETHNLVPGQSVPRNFNISLHNYILTTRNASHDSWIPPKSPCWILMHMVTRPSHRGKGAAGLLIRWGIEKANEDGVPAYLEAGVMGKPIYERNGFLQIGDPLEVDLKNFGVDMTFTLCHMAYFPRAIAEEEINPVRE